MGLICPHWASISISKISYITTIDHIGKIYSIHNKLFIDAFPKGLFVSIKKLRNAMEEMSVPLNHISTKD